MHPNTHFIFGLIFASVLLILFPEINLMGFFIILASTVLIDVDHYLIYVFKKKDFSLRKAYRRSIQKKKKLLSLSRNERDKYYIEFCFLHGIEILIILFFISFFFKYLFYVFLGFAFHLLLDVIHQSTFWNRLDRISSIYDFLKYKKLTRI